MSGIKRRLTAALIIAGVFLCDQGVKRAVRQTPYGRALLRIPGLVEITHCVNTGAAFSMLEGRTALIALLSIALMAALVVFMLRERTLTIGTRAALSVLVGGGLGNLADRVVYGGVTDYIRLLFIRFPVFNLADICITCAVAFLILELLTGRLDIFSEKTDDGF